MYLLTCFTVRKINKVEFFKCRDCRAIFSNSSRKDSNAQFTIVPLNPYSDIKKTCFGAGNFRMVDIRINA